MQASLLHRAAIMITPSQILWRMS